MARQEGKTAKLYYLTTGTRAAWPNTGEAPNMSEITQARDITVGYERPESDASGRGIDFEEVLSGQVKAPLEFELPVNPADNAFKALRNAFFAGSMVGLAVMDGNGATANTRGFWADFEILKFEDSRPLNGAAMVKITAKPSAASDVPPALVTVGAAL